jgi:hypothetical protein
LYWSRRHQYLTLVYQVDAGAKRRLRIGRKRTLKTLLGFFRWFGPKRSQADSAEEPGLLLLGRARHGSQRVWVRPG